ncbi:beta-1,3-N-acetylglucosaminyltransferase radical fringe-like [Lytechinus variegatus]|uniref:beta-1,3-N-acetylglucosaminyltransferase radical fringe-like n=1 Tax=Lytechinus variegatus TaxID=7654 RepID=UPI001BB20CD2|nr:beta-1,3-N-acetylglucosaminyltransferase radical fringe-like [Lytechinus variegatus]
MAIHQEKLYIFIGIGLASFCVIFLFFRPIETGVHQPLVRCAPQQVVKYVTVKPRAYLNTPTKDATPAMTRQPTTSQYPRKKTQQQQDDDDRDVDIVLQREKYRQTELNDVFIGVKTTEKYHSTRLQLILDTWFSLAPEQTYFFTDGEDMEPYQNKTNGHMVNTGCKQIHSPQGLCCKLSAIFSSFKAFDKRWYCHVDDDNYLNIPQLLALLRGYDHNQDYYLGKPSVTHSIKGKDHLKNTSAEFWFGTGGAGVCYSKALVPKMMPYASRGKFGETCARAGRPDDMTIGFIVDYLLNGTLTKIPTFNSHIQNLTRLPTEDLHNQVTLSYSLNDKKIKGPNIINMRPIMEDDPTRFKSFHCTYFRGYGNCTSS